jgi:hypothetical protein
LWNHAQASSADSLEKERLRVSAAQNLQKGKQSFEAYDYKGR